MKNVMIRYTLKDDVAIDDVKAAATRFIDAMREHSGAILYTSYQEQEAQRCFVHVGMFPDAEVVKSMQAKPFFGEFSAFLGERCAEGPAVTWLSPVASTHIGK